MDTAEWETFLFPTITMSNSKAFFFLCVLKWPKNKKKIISSGLPANLSIELEKRSTMRRVFTTGAIRTIFLSFVLLSLMEVLETASSLTLSRTSLLLTSFKIKRRYARWR